ncbi:MAG: TldD/PmbA family protein [Deltaproteobacteria bacterium]|nr:TldD/PmbA family protein [Deltaproteobacteria bacterium]
MSVDKQTQALVRLASEVVERALKKGVDIAEVLVSEGSHLATKVRLGEPELVEEASSRSMGMRVMSGQQVAVTSTSDMSAEGITRFIEDALELVQLAQPDPFAGPPDASLLAKPEDHPELRLFDPAIDNLDARQALELGKQAESAALSSDKRLTNSEGATVARVSSASALVTSGGFRGAVCGTYASITVSPVADDADGKKRSGYYWSATRHLSDLKSAQFVGEQAARRTLAKLGARKIDTQEVAVIFEPDAARSVVRLFASCILGGSIWRKSSYLVGREGTRVASDLVTIVDDPLIAKGPGSRPFDGDGLASRRNTVVDDGILKTYLLDTYSARKLDKNSTASGSRTASGSVGASTSNFILRPGEMTPEDLISTTERALYVTDMMGFGFNSVTGDFSRGASGFWVQGGEICFPVSEVTISLNLDKLLQRIDMVANDLDLRTAIASPTFRVNNMIVAGR